MVTGYRNEYAQAIINFLIDARDAIRERAIPDPKIVVKIACKKKRSVVTITDNAGGIAEDIIGKIFDPYFTTKGPDKGTGIGLFMCKTMIERNMHASLRVHNNQNRGLRWVTQTKRTFSHCCTWKMRLKHGN